MNSPVGLFYNFTIFMTFNEAVQSNEYSDKKSK